jgi:hypothetical protein
MQWNSAEVNESPERRVSDSVQYQPWQKQSAGLAITGSAESGFHRSVKMKLVHYLVNVVDLILVSLDSHESAKMLRQTTVLAPVSVNPN